MVTEDSREYKAAQELERALNDYSWNPKRFAESTRSLPGHHALGRSRPVPIQTCCRNGS